MQKTRQLQRALLAIACSASLAVAAQTAPVKNIDVPPGELAQALETLRRQTGGQLLYRGDQMAGVRTQGVRGNLTAEEALERLLEGSGFEVRKDPSGAILIKKSEAAPKPTPRAEPAGQEEVTNIPAIMVTGARTLNTDIRRSRNDIQPYVIIDKEMIEKSGAVNVEDLLKNHLTMLGSPQTVVAGSNRTVFRLRGLQSSETLVLIDGRRTASVGIGGAAQQADLNGIPLAAVERIEILPTTASSIYGGSATGGVINVVLRRDYSGVEARMANESAFGGGGGAKQFDFSAGFGLNDGKTNIAISGGYSNIEPVLQHERDILERAREHILAINPEAIIDGFFPPLGGTTNIRSLGRDLTLKGSGTSLGSTITHVPAGYAGAHNDAGLAFVDAAGKYNLGLANSAQTNGGGGASLIGGGITSSLAASVQQEVTPNIRVFLELAATNNSVKSVVNNAFSSFVIPSTAPNNPFEQTIRVTTPALGANRSSRTRNSNRKAIVGATVKMPGNWSAHADHVWSRGEFSSSTPGGLNASAASAVSTGEVDVLRDTNVYPVSFSEYVIRPNTFEPVRATLRDTNIRFAGPLWKMPADAARLSILLEHRDERLEDQLQSRDTSYTFFPNRSQRVDSLYFELMLPIISNRNASRGVNDLSIQVAGRLERYRTVGANSISSPRSGPPLRGPIQRVSNEFTSIDPAVGFQYKPTSGLMFRASYSTGFLPPAINQLVPTAQSLPGNVFSYLSDPRRGGEPLGALGNEIISISGGNEKLLPEESKSVAIGVVVTPKAIPGLRVSADWIKIRKTNNIRQVAFGVQSDFDKELLVPGLFIRGPVPEGDEFDVGPVIGINTGLFNVARQRVEALDLAFDYQWDQTKFGSFSFAAVGTRQIHNETQVVTGTNFEENVGLVNNLKWNVNATLTWERRRWMAAWTTRYFSSYWLNRDHATDPNQGSASIPRQIYHDFFGRYRFDHGSFGRLSWLANVEVRFGIKNIFGTKPPIDATLYPYYSMWGDPKLPSYHLSIQKAF